MANEGSSNKCKNLAKVKDSETTNTDAVVLSNEKATQSTFVDMKLICENCKQVNKRNSYANFYFFIFISDIDFSENNFNSNRFLQKHYSLQ